MKIGENPSTLLCLEVINQWNAPSELVQNYF